MVRLRYLVAISSLAVGAAAFQAHASDESGAKDLTIEAEGTKAESNSTLVETNVPAGFELVWSDEFERAGQPDATKWKYDTFRNAEGWFNNEKQYYSAARAKNARVENGVLVIEAHREALDGAGLTDWGGQEYSSARLITQGLGDWTYGFYEIRAKLPCGRGSWPAIWMLPSDPDVEWPAGGEIDIMEHVGFDPGVIHNSVHTTAFNFSRGTQKTSKFELSTVCESMHKYQLLWAPEFLLFAVDDAPKFLFKKESAKQSRWPFDKPMHLLLNVAVGGDWGGQKGIDPDAFPQRMEVDYVRVYQQSE